MKQSQLGFLDGTPFVMPVLDQYLLLRLTNIATNPSEREWGALRSALSSRHLILCL